MGVILVIILLASLVGVWVLDSGPLALWDSGWWLVWAMLAVVGFVCSLCTLLAVGALAVLA